ncbi:MAG: hypothetical protein KF864_02190 [Phycisphaeraceae bacterium]|nr:hypothetical protein [Phycisphaeraceae bacterium]
MKHILAISAALSLAMLVTPACEKESQPVPAPAPANPAPTNPAQTPAPAPAPSPAPSTGPATFSAGDLRFDLPAGWQSVPPANAMRLAEVHVPAPQGADPAAICLLTFSRAGGNIEDNITRWAGQVRTPDGAPATPVRTTIERAGLTITLVEFRGTFMDGMPGSSQPPTAREGWIFRGAILPTQPMATFIRMTGPAESMLAAEEGWQSLVASARTQD